jgi:serine/threonine protein kinase
MIMGTAGYMSPEQAQGKVREIDHRSDIFSFGCILFEAATGQKAFAGTDVLDSLHKIVHAPTPQIKDFNTVAPAELQRIVRRCLAKGTEERYQSIKEVAIELNEIRRELKDISELEYSVQPESIGGERASTSPQAKIDSAQHSAAGATQAEIARSTSSADLVSEVKRYRTGVFLALIGIAVVIAGGIGLHKFLNRSNPPPAPFQALKMTKLTSNGKATSAVISPDGKQVVYVIDDEGRTSLWLRQVVTATDERSGRPDVSAQPS